MLREEPAARSDGFIQTRRPAMSAAIDESDVRAMVRLVAETASLRAEHAAAKRRLMGGLKELVRADHGTWMLGYVHPGRPPAMISVERDGSAGENCARCMEAIGPGFDEGLMRFEETPVPRMLSAVRVDDRCISVIGLCRRKGRLPFNERERRIAGILFTEVSWLHASGWPQGSGTGIPELSRQRRLVLDMMLKGAGRKEAAEKLGISFHTVCDYVKDIYATFKVRSHAELIKRFMKGG